MTEALNPDGSLNSHRGGLSGHPWTTQLIAAVAAFCVYFCMYAFRKPFTAATLEGQEFLGLGLKSLLVLSQLTGYMLSKFIGIKMVSEMPRQRRAWSIVVLIAIAELALVGYAVLPVPGKILMLFLNGLPLGMIFGLVLAYLEGRRHTEAMTAILCASFIAASGFVKSVGTWLMSHGVSEFQMPFLTGILFLVPLLCAVWILERTPDPDSVDRQLRSHRPQMDRALRRNFFRTYAPGLMLLILIYSALTIVRTIRDDFAVEIWQDLGVDKMPSVFAKSEAIVAILVTVLNGAAFFIRRNLTALISVLLLMAAGFAVVGGAFYLQEVGRLSAFPFMVACGVGLYIPYVAFHTTVFERLVAASVKVANLGFLMYLADALGYLGYAVLVFAQALVPTREHVFSLFRISALITIVLSVTALVFCAVYFWYVLRAEERHRLSQLEGEATTAGSGLEPLPQ